MDNTRYVRREWLNRSESPSTGSIVVFDGKQQYREKDDANRHSWVEVADCGRKVSLHRIYEDTEDDFIFKVRKMRDVLTDFLNHLEKVKGNE